MPPTRGRSLRAALTLDAGRHARAQRLQRGIRSQPTETRALRQAARRTAAPGERTHGRSSVGAWNELSLDMKGRHAGPGVRGSGAVRGGVVGIRGRDDGRHVRQRGTARFLQEPSFAPQLSSRSRGRRRARRAGARSARLRSSVARRRRPSRGSAACGEPGSPLTRAWKMEQYSFPRRIHATIPNIAGADV